MTYALYFIAGILALLNTLFVLYVFSMNVQRVQETHRMTAWHWLLAGAYVILAIALDVVLNYTVLALMTWDFPKAKEYTFSQRLNRLVKDTGWRGVAARGIAFVLNPFDSDPRGHVRMDDR